MQNWVGEERSRCCCCNDKIKLLPLSANTLIHLITGLYRLVHFDTDSLTWLLSRNEILIPRRFITIDESATTEIIANTETILLVGRGRGMAGRRGHGLAVCASLTCARVSEESLQITCGANLPADQTGCCSCISCRGRVGELVLHRSTLPSTSVYVMFMLPMAFFLCTFHSDHPTPLESKEKKKKK